MRHMNDELQLNNDNLTKENKDLKDSIGYLSTQLNRLQVDSSLKTLAPDYDSLSEKVLE